MTLVAMLATGCAPVASGDTPAPSDTAQSMAPLPAPGPDEAVIVTTYGSGSDSVFASGIVPERANEEGTCTLTATDGNVTRSASLEAGPTPTAMNCGEIRVQVSEGAWRIRLEYTSGAFTGSSGTIEVDVP